MYLVDVLLFVVPAVSLIVAVMALDGRFSETDRPQPFRTRLLIALGALGVGSASCLLAADIVQRM